MDSGKETSRDLPQTIHVENRKVSLPPTNQKERGSLSTDLSDVLKSQIAPLISEFYL